MSEDAEPNPVVDEEALVRFSRYREGRNAGLSHDQAWEFADDFTIDVGMLRRLVEKGCPTECLAKILL
jgi:hypothetical protein